MQYYRCKCGSREAWGSMPPYPCDKCPKCGSNLAWSADAHTDPLPHDFSSVEKVSTDQGDMTRTRCRYCGLTKSQIEKRDAADAASD